MKLKQRHIFYAWLLMATLLPLSLTKATHHHTISQEQSVPYSDSGSDTCPICQFSLSAFVKAPALTLPAGEATIICHHSPAPASIILRQPGNNRLRAPPAC